MTRSDIVTAEVIALTQPLPHTGIPGPAELVAYCARVSNPGNQHNHDTADRLLNFCKRKAHWSVFQMTNAVVEMTGPRDILRQFTRHESIVVSEDEAGDFYARPDGFDAKAGGIQEFSGRYAQFPDDPMYREPRRQDHTNRQNSIADLPPGAVQASQEGQREVHDLTRRLYIEALDRGEAKETARVILPEGLTPSRLYANGTLRSWMHFIVVRRDGPGVTEEHRWLAAAAAEALAPHFEWLEAAE